MINNPQKPLKRIDIEEVGGEVPVPDQVWPGVPSGSVPQDPSWSPGQGQSQGQGQGQSQSQGQSKEAGDQASPLSTSPSAKVLKIEEISDVPTQTAARYVGRFFTPSMGFCEQQSFKPVPWHFTTEAITEGSALKCFLRMKCCHPGVNPSREWFSMTPLVSEMLRAMAEYNIAVATTHATRGC